LIPGGDAEAGLKLSDPLHTIKQERGGRFLAN
jgi:hypothetical protein